jgi:hypothetical protein
MCIDPVIHEIGFMNLPDLFPQGRAVRGATRLHTCPKQFPSLPLSRRLETIDVRSFDVSQTCCGVLWRLGLGNCRTRRAEDDSMLADREVGLRIDGGSQTERFEEVRAESPQPRVSRSKLGV